MEEPGPKPQDIPASNAPQSLQTQQCHKLHNNQVVHLNWSHFKPEFSGKPDEDAEAHVLCTNDWINAQHFVKGVRVQRYCFTLLGEVKPDHVSFIRAY